jgi:hypothetical protein
MKTWRHITSGATLVLVIGTAGTIAGASPTPLDPLLIPTTQTNETFRYHLEERLSGAVKHVHSEAITYRVLSSESGTLRFEREISGKGKGTFTRDPSGALDGRLALSFFLPRQILGDPPTPLAVGQTWQVRLPMETFLGSPGTATLSVVSLDAATRHVVLHVALRGEGDARDTTPVDTTPTTFHTTTNRRGTIELTNGIVDSSLIAGDDRQSANQSTPITVHIELSAKRAK